jgi:hypothetical protein
MSTQWNNADLVFRQVNPNHWDGKIPNSQAFFPTPKDTDKLSVDDASVVSAEGSWKHFTKNLGFASVGTWAVSFEEVESAGDLELTKNPVVNPNDATKNNPAHCLINFGKLTTKGQKKKRAQHLAIKASARGCQFTPPA